MKIFGDKILRHGKFIVNCYFLVLITTLAVIYSVYCLRGVIISVSGAMVLGAIFGGIRGIVGTLASLALETWENGLMQIPMIILEVTALCFTITISSDNGLEFSLRTVGVFIGGGISFVSALAVTVMILSIIDPESHLNLK